MSVIKITLTAATFVLVASGSFADPLIERNGRNFITSYEDCPQLSCPRASSHDFPMPIINHGSHGCDWVIPFNPNTFYLTCEWIDCEKPEFPAWYSKTYADMRPSCGSRHVNLKAAPGSP